MSHKKYFTIFIFLVLLINIFSPLTSASNKKINLENFFKESSNVGESNDKRIIDRLIMIIYALPFKLIELGLPAQTISQFFKWVIFRLVTPPIFVSEPTSIDIRYLNNSFIEIGMKNETGNWRTDFQGWPFADEEYYTFKLDLPEGIPEGSIVGTFFPTARLEPKIGKETKVTLKIETYFPEDFEIPDQFILRVNVTRYQVINNLLKNAYERFANTPFQKIKFILFDWWAVWLQFLHIQGVDKKTIYVELVVRENRFHLLEIEPRTEKYILAPDVIEEIPIKVRNLGSHKDSFNFNIITDNDEDILLAAPNSVSLDPFEEKTVYISVATPRFFNNPGTLHDIKIIGYSVYDPDNKFNNTIAVVTEGIYISEGFLIGSVPILIFLLVIVYLFYIRRKRKIEKLFAKPDKPWEIPEEKEHLEKLKQKDKKKFKETMEMMQEEYQSSLLWYKHYCGSILQKRKLEAQKERQRIKDLKREAKAKEKKKIVEKKKEEIKKIEEKKPKELEIEEKITEEPKIEEKRKPVVDKKAEMERRRKEQALIRIKRDQEKQKRKLGNTI